MNIFIASVVTLGVIGCVAAIILYLVAKKFKVEEDPRIDKIEGVLPGANCGGCGYPGCRGFADACVKGETLEGKRCPVGGDPVMKQVSEILGMTVESATPKVAVVRCNGSCAARPRTSTFNGSRRCEIMAQLYSGETGCAYGCLGCGDCVDACAFGAIHINETTGLPEVDEEKCTACGACMKACPKKVIELRNKGVKNRRVFVSCINKERGAKARKACASACIGCGKCAKACPFEAITLQDNVAYIDYEKCRLCRKCVAECPTGAIHDINFPTPVVKAEKKPIAPKAEKIEEVERVVKIEKVEAPKTETIEIQEVVRPIEKPVKKSAETSKVDEPQIEVVTEPIPEVKAEIVIEEVKAEENKVEEVIETKEKAVEVEEVKVIKETNKPEEVLIKEETPIEEPSSNEEETPVKDIQMPIIPDVLPDDFDIKSLIPEELRVKPLEKVEKNKEAKAEEKPSESAMPTLDL